MYSHTVAIRRRGIRGYSNINPLRNLTSARVLVTLHYPWHSVKKPSTMESENLAPNLPFPPPIDPSFVSSPETVTMYFSNTVVHCGCRLLLSYCCCYFYGSTHTDYSNFQVLFRNLAVFGILLMSSIHIRMDYHLVCPSF